MKALGGKGSPSGLQGQTLKPKMNPLVVWHQLRKEVVFLKGDLDPLWVMNRYRLPVSL